MAAELGDKNIISVGRDILSLMAINMHFFFGQPYKLYVAALLQSSL
jgi:hypothetical protein